MVPDELVCTHFKFPFDLYSFWFRISCKIKNKIIKWSCWDSNYFRKLWDWDDYVKIMCSSRDMRSGKHPVEWELTIQDINMRSKERRDYLALNSCICFIFVSFYNIFHYTMEWFSWIHGCMHGLPHHVKTSCVSLYDCALSSHFALTHHSLHWIFL